MKARAAARSRSATRIVATVLAAVVAHAPVTRAQGRPMTKADSALLRAQRLSSEGQAGAARALVDSMLTAAPDGAPEYAEALFWRATLSETAQQARRDYLRIVVEFPRSPRAEDALLRLAQNELARGNRAAAKRHLEQLALEHPAGASQAQGAYWTGRVLFEEGSVAAACAAFADARGSVSGADVELSNQISYYGRQCAGAQRIAEATRADSIARVDSTARADSLARAVGAPARAAPRVEGRAAPRAPTGGPTWSAQVAAYSTQEDAKRLAKRLAARGYDVRVTPARPFRVRIGRFARRADAAVLVHKLKLEKVFAIVVEGERQ